MCEIIYFNKIFIIYMIKIISINYKKYENIIIYIEFKKKKYNEIL
jgi:hypothetical protein